MMRQPVPAALGALAVMLTLVGPVSAAPPSNDDVGLPTPIALPSTTSQSTVEATTGTTDPGCTGGGHSVWFSYTAAADGALRVTTFGSDFDTVLALGTPDGAGGISVIGCNDDSGGLQSEVRFDAAAGTTYLIMAGSFSDLDGGNLVLNLEVAPPPPPPPFIDLTIAPLGEFTPAGLATIRGTIACSADLQLFELRVTLEQQVGRVVIVGSASGDSVACGPSPVPWTLVVSADNGKFLGGHATATASAFGCHFECAEASMTAAIRLRR